MSDSGKKHIDLSKSDISQKLTIDFIIRGPSNCTIPGTAAPLGDRPPTTQRRYPWDLIPETYYKGLNLVITLNPDTLKIEDYNNKKYVNNILINYINNEETIQKAIGVYEWGKQGAHYGKLHYHFLIKTLDRSRIEQNLLDLFNSRRNLRDRTLYTKLIKDVDHRNTAIKYLKKEQQNKSKCLFIKNLDSVKKNL